MSTKQQLSENMLAILATVKDARSGKISGHSIAAWLNKSRHPEGIREGLRALVNRGLIEMFPQDDPLDEFRRMFPDRLKALYSIREEANHG